MRLAIAIIALVLAQSAIAQDFEVVFPQNNHTYGWNTLLSNGSGGYFNASIDLETTDPIAKEIFKRIEECNGAQKFVLRPEVRINTEKIKEYQVLIDGKGLCRFGAATFNEDCTTDCREPLVTTYPSTDTLPFDRYVPVPATRTVNNWTFIPYDYEGKMLTPVSVIFFFSYELEEMFDILELKREYEYTPEVSEEDFLIMGLDPKISSLYEVRYKVKELRLRYKGTTIERNHTRITVVFTPKAKMVNVTLYNIMGKPAVPHLDNVHAQGDFKVLSTDPIITWDLGEKEDIEFDIDEVEEDKVKEIKIIAVADKVEQQGSWGLIFFAVSTVAIVFGLVYFSRFQRGE